MNLEASMRPYLNQFGDELKKYLLNREFEPEELYEAVRHLPSQEGAKRLRPIVSLLAAQAVGGDSKKVMPYAVSMELLHSFTLVHDDIMDQCDMRRGVEAVHAKWDSNMGILAGDTLYALVFELLENLEIESDLFKRIVVDVAKLSREICEGQYWDMHFENQKRVDEQLYYHMIERKTASFFEVAMKNGAEIGGGDPRAVKKLAECGRLLGLAFQTWDDYLGVTATEEESGKTAFSDIVNGKKSLPYVATHAGLDAFDRRKFVDLYKQENKSEDDIKELLKFMKAGGGIDYTRDRARQFSSYAKASIAELPETAAKRMLGMIAEYASARTH